MVGITLSNRTVRGRCPFIHIKILVYLDENLSEDPVLDHWPSNSPDLNSIDYSIWPHLARKVLMSRFEMSSICVKSFVKHGIKSPRKKYTRVKKSFRKRERHV